MPGPGRAQLNFKSSHDSESREPFTVAHGFMGSGLDELDLTMTSSDARPAQPTLLAPEAT
jgi:hypothetical protein